MPKTRKNDYKRILQSVQRKAEGFAFVVQSYFPTFYSCLLRSKTHFNGTSSQVSRYRTIASGYLAFRGLYTIIINYLEAILQQKAEWKR